MNTEEEDLIRRAMSAIGRRTSDRKRATSAENGAKAKAIVQSEEHRAKLREAQTARREREKQERIERGEQIVVATEKRKPGRPKNEETGTAIDAPKRPVGRPKKGTPTITEETPE